MSSILLTPIGNNEQARGIDEITGENSGIPDSARRRVNPVARRRAVDVGTAMAVIEHESVRRSGRREAVDKSLDELLR
jgi:hypothetical protein